MAIVVVVGDGGGGGGSCGGGCRVLDENATSAATHHRRKRARPDNLTDPDKGQVVPFGRGETGTHYLPRSPIVPGLVSVSPGRRIE